MTLPFVRTSSWQKKAAKLGTRPQEFGAAPPPLCGLFAWEVLPLFSHFALISPIFYFFLAVEKAKRMLLTGDLITAQEAKEIGLLTFVVPKDQLDSEVDRLVTRIAQVPKNQLQMQKLVINKTYENMGLNTTQTMATLMDGIARNSPEGVYFKKRMEQVGFKQAVLERDSGDPLKSKM